MSRRLRYGAAALVAAAGVASFTMAAAATGGSLERPDSHLSHIYLRYKTPLQYPNGSLATSPPLSPAVIPAAEADFTYLSFEQVSDLGGFEPAPIGEYLSGTTGHAVANGPRQAHVPFLGGAGRNGTKIYGFVHGLTPPTTVPTPPPSTIPTPPTTSTTVPGAPSSTTTTTTTLPVRPPLYIKMTNNHNRHPLIRATNMAPGDVARETVVLGNRGDVPFVVRLRTVGSSNALARQLRLTVRVVGGSLLYSGRLSASGVRIARLSPGQSIDLWVSLRLPRSAGNGLQLRRVRLDLYWSGQG